MNKLLDFIALTVAALGGLFILCVLSYMFFVFLKTIWPYSLVPITGIIIFWAFDRVENIL